MRGQTTPDADLNEGIVTNSNNTTSVIIPLTSSDGTSNDQVILTENENTDAAIIAISSNNDSMLMISSVNNDGLVSNDIHISDVNSSNYQDRISLSTDSSGNILSAITIDEGNTVEVDSDSSIAGVSQAFVFSGSSGTLLVDAPASFSGTISNFTAGDAIDLVGSADISVVSGTFDTTITNGALSLDLVSYDGQGDAGALNIDPENQESATSLSLSFYGTDLSDQSLTVLTGSSESISLSTSINTQENLETFTAKITTTIGQGDSLNLNDIPTLTNYYLDTNPDNANSQLSAVIVTNQQITFSGADGEVGLTQEDQGGGLFYVTMNNLQLGDTIDLINENVISAFFTVDEGPAFNAAADGYNGGIETIDSQGNIQTIPISNSGDFSGDNIALSSDGNGGTYVTVTSGNPVDSIIFSGNVLDTKGNYLGEADITLSYDPSQPTGNRITLNNTYTDTLFVVNSISENFLGHGIINSPLSGSSVFYGSFFQGNVDVTQNFATNAAYITFEPDNRHIWHSGALPISTDIYTLPDELADSSSAVPGDTLGSAGLLVVPPPSSFLWHRSGFVCRDEYLCRLLYARNPHPDGSRRSFSREFADWRPARYRFGRDQTDQMDRTPQLRWPFPRG